MTPWLADPDCCLYLGDNLDVLRALPDRSVHMCATSPPFWSLRDYGVDGQIGLEDDIDAWADSLVAVFAEVKRVLRDDGTLWLELGDSFSDKQLVGQPWRVAFALQRAGWFLRSEIIWARLRPNPMPESVTDRPTKAHSTVFLLSKQPRYYFDQDAIREAYSPHSDFGNAIPTEPMPSTVGDAVNDRRIHARLGNGSVGGNHTGANARSVWTIPTQPTPFAHFATWPEALVRRMILAGTSERGCCPGCGAPWTRDTETERGGPTTKAEREAAAGGTMRTTYYRIGKEHTPTGKTPGSDTAGFPSATVTTVGWSPSCTHDHQPVPCTVLDPFAGSATTMLVARNHGRHSVGIELNESYLEIAAKRLQQLSLFSSPSEEMESSTAQAAPD